MLPTLHQLREQLRLVIEDKRVQGHLVDGLHDELEALPASYDALAEFAERLADLPFREDWPYIEPSDLETIWAECDPDRPTGVVGAVDLQESARRVEAAFLSSVCWLTPFNDDLRTGLARFYERSLAAVARRMGSLPGQVSKEIIHTKPTRVQQSSQDAIEA